MDACNKFLHVNFCIKIEQTEDIPATLILKNERWNDQQVKMTVYDVDTMFDSLSLFIYLVYFCSVIYSNLL